MSKVTGFSPTTGRTSGRYCWGPTGMLTTSNPSSDAFRSTSAISSFLRASASSMMARFSRAVRSLSRTAGRLLRSSSSDSDMSSTNFRPPPAGKIRAFGCWASSRLWT